MIKLFAVVGMIAVGWWLGYQHGHQQVAAECERLGGFFVGKKIYKCHASRISRRPMMIKRKTPLRAKTPMARKPLSAKPRVNRGCKERAKSRCRSPAYLAWVRTQPCVVCGALGNVAAHHLIGMYGLSGMGLKAGDDFAMPACDPAAGSFNDCHQHIHANKALRDQQPKFLITTLEAAIRVHSGEKKARLITAMEFIKSKEFV